MDVSCEVNMDIVGWISKSRYVLRITMDTAEYQLDNINGYLK
jgi:hypothetical protein